MYSWDTDAKRIVYCCIFLSQLIFTWTTSHVFSDPKDPPSLRTWCPSNATMMHKCVGLFPTLLEWVKALWDLFEGREPPDSVYCGDDEWCWTKMRISGGKRRDLSEMPYGRNFFTKIHLRLTPSAYRCSFPALVRLSALSFVRCQSDLIVFICSYYTRWLELWA